MRLGDVRRGALDEDVACREADLGVLAVDDGRQREDGPARVVDDGKDGRVRCEGGGRKGGVWYRSRCRTQLDAARTYDVDVGLDVLHARVRPVEVHERVGAEGSRL